MELKKKLTLVYLSNKPSLLDIQIEYLHDVKLFQKAEIIFAAYNYKKQTHIENFGVEIENGMSRLCLAIKSIKTEYCKLCADDDLFVVSEILPQLNRIFRSALIVPQSTQINGTESSH